MNDFRLIYRCAFGMLRRFVVVIPAQPALRPYYYIIIYRWLLRVPYNKSTKLSF